MAMQQTYGNSEVNLQALRLKHVVQHTEQKTMFCISYNFRCEMYIFDAYRKWHCCSVGKRLFLAVFQEAKIFYPTKKSGIISIEIYLLSSVCALQRNEKQLYAVRTTRTCRVADVAQAQACTSHQ